MRRCLTEWSSRYNLVSTGSALYDEYRLRSRPVSFKGARGALLGPCSGGCMVTDLVDVKAAPLVSVIIPTHNRAPQLRAALRSVFAQEGRSDLFDLDVIVIDDASTDDTCDVVREFPLARYLRFDVNRGPSAARNAGINVCKGRYVAFLDDDDIWLSTHLKVQVPILEQQ